VAGVVVPEVSVGAVAKGVGLLGALYALSGCDLVLGIDDVSSANGPDAGQMIQGVSEDPDSGAAGRGRESSAADGGERDDTDAGTP
jgi:hypothetical protein